MKMKEAVRRKGVKKEMSKTDIKDSDVTIFGDFMIDEYIYCNVERISPEAPVPIAKVLSREKRLGGAGNVLNNLLSLGCVVSAFIPCINDSEILDVLSPFSNLNQMYLYFPEGSCNIKKQRIIGNNKSHMLRIDYEQEDMLPKYEEWENAIKAILETTNYIIISDYGKGSINDTLLDFIKQYKKKESKILIDPYVYNMSKYPNSYICKLNHLQYEDILKMKAIPKSNYTIVTKGAEGAIVYNNKKGIYTEIHGEKHEVVDVTGAGDVFLATLTKALLQNFQPEAAAYVANKCSGISVTKLGTISIDIETYQTCIGPII